jgi:hypothetical protein
MRTNDIPHHTTEDGEGTKNSGLEVDELEVFDVALLDSVAIGITRRYGPTGIAAADASCTFGASMCGWNEVDPATTKPLATGSGGASWDITATGSSSEGVDTEQTPANDHTFGSTSTPLPTDCTPDATTHNGPCFLEVLATHTAEADGGAATSTSTATLSSPWLRRPVIGFGSSISSWCMRYDGRVRFRLLLRGCVSTTPLALIFGINQLLTFTSFHNSHFPFTGHQAENAITVHAFFLVLPPTCGCSCWYVSAVLL